MLSMARTKTEDKVRTAVAHVGETITEKAWTVGRDKKAEARKRWLWGLLQAGIGAGFTVFARRGASRAWTVVTGEQPPPAQKR
jgi:hypothetical protein